MNGPLPGGPEGPFAEATPLRLPRPPETFSRRADRFRALAPGHAAGDFLEALSRLAEAQVRAVDQLSLPPPSPSGRAPPLGAMGWRRAEAWRQALSSILRDMAGGPLPPPALAALERLRSAPAERIEAEADALLAGALGRVDLAGAVFVGAALQVYWTALASRLRPEAVERADRGCPVCGCPPVAGTVHGDSRLRYLACSLCGSEWHRVRLQCALCGEGEGLSYLGLEGAPRAVKAEACRACGGYLKLFYLDREPAAEPVADDVATLALDVLLAEEGYHRGGVNLFLLSAEGD